MACQRKEIKRLSLIDNKDCKVSLISKRVHQYNMILIFFGCRLGIDEELVALLGNDSPVGDVLAEFINYNLS